MTQPVRVECASVELRRVDFAGDHVPQKPPNPHIRPYDEGAFTHNSPARRLKVAGLSTATSREVIRRGVGVCASAWKENEVFHGDEHSVGQEGDKGSRVFR
jgi:hypothetical protein